MKTKNSNLSRTKRVACLISLETIATSHCLSHCLITSLCTKCAKANSIWEMLLNIKGSIEVSFKPGQESEESQMDILWRKKKL